ncbi:BCL2/adenovirus E1B 19 kDa protein-interacting protein 2 isoform X2 [Sinocyclocheilus rhinocerous]|uniref:BCL2/adenovirus E1B 19 kDa protein-interacting protein 2 isoform X2 n=1 Tax=Sinocyclocheilus rhinocerous TaxID=307959 RepID=UPI0007B7AB4D|nr:PREDICTED: BCL2/adenovirus E1B 19 kDa protein-interacting protein 2-like isoform X2 [Sinocyclocheilus rhinocerous]
MATDVIATEEVSNQRDSSDLNASKSNPESDTPNRTSETQENRNISSALSLSSSVHSGEEPPQDSIAGNSPANGGSAIRPGDPPQEAATPDNRQKQGVRTSTPVRAPQTLSSPAEHNGSFEHQESVATTEARLRMEGVELKEEWQDEDFPRPLPEEEDIQLDEELFTGSSGEGAPASQSYGLNSAKKTKKKLLAPDISLNLDHSEGSVLSDELDESTELDLDDIDTPSDNSNEFEWEDDLPKPKNADLLRKGVESVQEFTSTEEREEGRRWRVFHIGEQEHRVDMKAIEPYKRVIGHGGYYGDGLNAIIVFAVCFMPESNQPNYRYIMDNLFKYVIGTLELLVAENYMIVYLNGATSRRKMPSVGWLRKCYQQIDRRLRKNLKSLMIVHPSWFIRTLLALTKPFISSKFSQKIKYVYSLTDLAELVPMEYVSIPDCIKQFDEEKNRKKRKRIDQDMRGKVEIATAAVPE